MHLRLTTWVGLVFVVTASALLAPRASAADTIYWANDGPNTISFAKLDGSGGGDVSTKGRVRFGKRIGKRMLAPGRYRITATLRDTSGNVSKPVRRNFTVLAR